MKALKIIATALLSLLLLASGAAAEAVALANGTALNPAFYGEVQGRAYAAAGRFAVRALSETVLGSVPPIALRTANAERAYALASEALRPAAVAALLQAGGPNVARFLLQGGDVPVLRDSDAFSRGMAEAVKALIMEEFWNKTPETADFPAFLPFTPEWNAAYARQLDRDLWLPRYYLGFRVQALLLTVAAATLFASLLYLLWSKRLHVFYNTAGALLCVNALVILLPSLLISFHGRELAEAAAAYYPVSEAAAFFGGEYTELFRAVLWPFREIFFVSSLVSASFGVTLFAMGLPARAPLRLPGVGRKRPATAKEARSDLREAAG